MEESTISTNVHIDFNKKNNVNKRPPAPRGRMGGGTFRKPKTEVSYDAPVYDGEIPVRI